MSKFGSILREAKERPRDLEHVTADPAPLPSPAPSPRPPGRPKTGKRSDPAFEQVSAYVPKSLYRDVRIALLEDDKGREFSEIVAELLTGWLKDRKRA